MSQYTVDMYLIYANKKEFYCDSFSASSADSAMEKAKKHYLGRHYPFCVASFYQKQIRDVEIISVRPTPEPTLEKINRTDYFSWLDLQDNCVDDDISSSDFARYFC